MHFSFPVLSAMETTVKRNWAGPQLGMDEQAGRRQKHGVFRSGVLPFPRIRARAFPNRGMTGMKRRERSR